MDGKKKRGIAVLVVKLAISVLLLMLLFWMLDAGTVATMLRTASVPLLALGAIWMLCLTALSAVKWRLLLREQGVSVPYLLLLRTYIVSQFINLFMPSIVGGDVYRAAKVRHRTAGVSKALPAIVVERCTGVAALAIVGILGLSHLLYLESFWLILAALVAAVVAGYVLLVWPVLRLMRKLDQSAGYGVVGVLTEILNALRPSWRFWAVVVLSFVFHLGVVVTSLIYSTATQIDVAFTQLMVAVPLVYLVEMLPVSINGIGVREGTLAGVFGLMGLVPEHGLLLGLTITIMRYVCFGTVGGTLLVSEIFAKSPYKKHGQLSALLSTRYGWAVTDTISCARR
jgi:glycosyltransferase 2 family protein